MGDVPWECPDLGKQTLARGSQKSLHHPTASPFLLMNPTAPVFNLSLFTALPKPAFVRSAHRAVFAADRAEGTACQQSPNFFFFLTKHPRVRIQAPVCVLRVLGSVFIVQAEGNTELRGLG